jgi:hypothetical protein
VIAEVWRFILAALVAGGASAMILRSVPVFAGVSGPLGALLRMVADSLLLGALYLIAVAVLHGGMAPLLQFRGLLLDMLPWHKYSRKAPAISLPTPEASDTELVTHPF